MTSCSKCGGDGVDPMDVDETCRKCQGTGTENPLTEVLNAGPRLTPPSLERESNASLLDTIRILTNERQALLDNLAATQARCTQLLDRARMMVPENVFEVATGVVKRLEEGRGADLVSLLLARWILEGKIN